MLVPWHSNDWVAISKDLRVMNTTVYFPEKWKLA